MADLKFNSFKKDLAEGQIDLTGDTINVMLVTSSYTPDIDAHSTRSDVTNEAAGAGYTTGGVALANKTVVQDNTNDLARFDADDVTWTGSTISAAAAVVYKSTGAAATDNLIAYYDFGGTETSSNGDFTITWNASGILTVS